MNRLPLLAAVFAASTFAFASCGNDTADDADDADTTMVVTDPMPADGTMTTTTGDTGMMNAGDGMTGTAAAGTTNADGSTTYSDGVTRSADGATYRRADGTTMTAEEVKSYQAVQGKVLTTDGTVKDRDADGRVGTAEVKEEYKQGRDAVKGAAKDVKKDVKD